MAYQQGLFPVLAKRNLAQNIYDLTILCPEIAGQAKAGQFVHIRVPGHVLRRPISIAGFDADQGTIRIIYEIRGEGTQILADYKAGDLIDVLGPLGNGYTLPKEGSRVVVVGGGIGVPPLLLVAERFGANAACIGAGMERLLLKVKSVDSAMHRLRFSRMISKKPVRILSFVLTMGLTAERALSPPLWRSIWSRSAPTISVLADPW